MALRKHPPLVHKCFTLPPAERDVVTSQIQIYNIMEDTQLILIVFSMTHSEGVVLDLCSRLIQGISYKCHVFL